MRNFGGSAPLPSKSLLCASPGAAAPLGARWLRGCFSRRRVFRAVFRPAGFLLQPTSARSSPHPHCLPVQVNWPYFSAPLPQTRMAGLLPSAPASRTGFAAARGSPGPSRAFAPLAILHSALRLVILPPFFRLWCVCPLPILWQLSLFTLQSSLPLCSSLWSVPPSFAPPSRPSVYPCLRVSVCWCWCVSVFSVLLCWCLRASCVFLGVALVLALVLGAVEYLQLFLQLHSMSAVAFHVCSCTPCLRILAHDLRQASLPQVLVRSSARPLLGLAMDATLRANVDRAMRLGLLRSLGRLLPGSEPPCQPQGAARRRVFPAQEPGLPVPTQPGANRFLDQPNVPVAGIMLPAHGRAHRGSPLLSLVLYLLGSVALPGLPATLSTVALPNALLRKPRLC